MRAALAATALVFAATPAHAQLVEEFRLGVFAHDVSVVAGGGDKEDGFNLALEAVFATPDFLEWAWSPEPYAMFSWNSAGETNFGGVGLAWDFDVTERFFGEFSVGYVLHDGVVALPENPGDPDRIRLDATRVVLGSRDLFRSVLAAGWRVNERWDAALVYEHLSHGQILGSGRNEGLDNLGVRISYNFTQR